ncbi:MAG: alanine racemase [bacterium]|jgi:alanine racemase|nr:alanine racemase [Betaproteobacteria bacterium]
MPRPLQAVIDMGALASNHALAKRLAPGARAFATIKADAYGHGTRRVERALAGADGFAVCEIEQAAALRTLARSARRDRPVLLLEGCFCTRDLLLCALEGITTVVHDIAQVEMLERTRLDPAVDVFVKMNSGMNRLGFAPSRFGAAVERLQALPAVRSITLMTHFASADEPEGIAAQMAVFEAHAAAFPGLPRSLANSAALLRYPESHADWVRPGLMLYGISPFADRDAASLGLQPAMRLESEVIAVQALVAGDRVGYAGTFRADGPMRVGIVACGYADGYPRHAPTGTPVLVDGQRSRLLGRVSMDMLAVDLTALPAAGVGCPVVLWGGALPAEEVATAAGTIAYELLCALAPRVPVREQAAGEGSMPGAEAD